MVEPLTAERAEDHDLLRARGDRLRDRELEIGFVLRRVELRDPDRLLRESLDARLSERVHVADDEVGKDLPPFERQRPSVGRDDHRAVGERRAVRGKHVAVRDDHRPHGRQRKSGA